MNLRALFCLALIHTLVDGYAQVIAPLWPEFQKELRLEAWAISGLIAVWQLATSISQPLFGLCGDRFSCRWVVGAGPALAIVCLSLIGLAGGPVGLALLLTIGGLGIGAFHPEAAVAAAEAAGPNSARALSLFVFGGMLGLGLGPWASGHLVQSFGLSALAWTMVPCLLLLGTLLVIGRPAASPMYHHAAPVQLAEALRGRGLAAGLLLLVATLRVVPAIGIPLALAFVLSKQGASQAEIGGIQSIYLFSGSIGALLSSWLIRPGREVRALFWATLPAAGFLLLVISEQHWAYYPGLVGSGFLLQGTIPPLIGYSQRLLPRGRRLAASLTLGTSWGLGGLVVAALQAYFGSIGWLEGMLWALVPFTLLAALSSWLLPELSFSWEPDPSPEPVAVMKSSGDDRGLAVDIEFLGKPD